MTTISAFGIAVCLTPLVRHCARRFDLVDYPDRNRKLHLRPTPLGGGLAILFALVLTVFCILVFSQTLREMLAHDFRFVFGGLVAALVVCVIGLLDDRFGLRGRQKLFGQFIAVSLWVASGLYVEKIQVGGFQIELGFLAIPFSLFWLVGAINAINLIDGADGLASSVGIVLSIAIACIATLAGHQTEAFLALVMIGALAGFLVYNGSRASIYLGDTGSMLIGLVLGGLAIRSSFYAPASVAIAIPLALWAIPILDVTMAILRRKLTGQSIYTTDRSHLHHIIQRRGAGGWKTVLIVGSLCSVTSVGAIFGAYLENDAIAIVVTGLVFAAVIGAGLFGRQECTFLVRRCVCFVRILILRNERRERSQLQLRLQGTRQWEDLWESLIQFADRFDLNEIQLNLTIPSIDYEYHSNWTRKNIPHGSNIGRLEIPLSVQDIPIGRLSLVGTSHGQHVSTWMSEMIVGLRPCETTMLRLMGECVQEQEQHPRMSVPRKPAA